MPTLKANQPDAVIAEIVAAVAAVVADVPVALAGHVRVALALVGSVPAGRADLAQVVTIAGLAMTSVAAVAAGSVAPVGRKTEIARRVRRRSRFAMSSVWKFCRSQQSR